MAFAFDPILGALRLDAARSAEVYDVAATTATAATYTVEFGESQTSYTIPSAGVYEFGAWIKFKMNNPALVVRSSQHLEIKRNSATLWSGDTAYIRGYALNQGANYGATLSVSSPRLKLDQGDVITFVFSKDRVAGNAYPLFDLESGQISILKL